MSAMTNMKRTMAVRGVPLAEMMLASDTRRDIVPAAVVLVQEQSLIGEVILFMIIVVQMSIVLIMTKAAIHISVHQDLVAIYRQICTSRPALSQPVIQMIQMVFVPALTVLLGQVM
jgi:hypothetical protein